jgi:hypothetical protein
VFFGVRIDAESFGTVVRFKPRREGGGAWQEACAPLTGHTTLVNVLAVAERQGRTVIVSGSHDKTQAHPVQGLWESAERTLGTLESRQMHQQALEQGGEECTRG